MNDDTYKDTIWAGNLPAQRIINGWFRKATKDAGNSYTRLLEDIGFCFDTRDGADFGNEPEPLIEQE